MAWFGPHLCPIEVNVALSCHPFLPPPRNPRKLLHARHKHCTRRRTGPKSLAAVVLLDSWVPPEISLLNNNNKLEEGLVDNNELQQQSISLNNNELQQQGGKLEEIPAHLNNRLQLRKRQNHLSLIPILKNRGAEGRPFWQKI